MKEKMMLVDANALGHVVKHATKELSWRGDRTGVLYGFIQKLFRIQADVLADRVVFCWDGDRNKLFRRDIYPEYKEVVEGSKTEKDIELDRIARPQFALLRTEVLPAIGFANNFLEEGLEADDIMAQLVKQYDWAYDMIIVSRDNDMHQLLCDGVMMYDPVKFGFFSADTFIMKWGIDPSEWEFVKAIAGCSGDNVPGVPGVKEKTAIKFIKGELNPTTKAHSAICEREEMCVSNLRLVKLPWEDTKPIDLLEDQLTVDGFIKVCTKFGFNSFFDKATDFRDLFIKE
jgi:DNA polymerase-1